jgi:hypothetical protein
MNKLDTVLAVGKIMRLAAGGMLYRRVVGNVAVIASLVVAIGMLAGALLLIGVYAAYLSLLQHGFDSGTAMIMVAAVIVMVIALCVALIMHYVQRIRTNLSPKAAVPNVGRIAHAFVDGLTEPRHKEYQREHVRQHHTR